MDSSVSDNIKRIIDEQGYKQKAIAVRAGFDEVEFCNMLNGRKVLRAEYIPQICEALGVSPSILLGMEERKGA